MSDAHGDDNDSTTTDLPLFSLSRLKRLRRGQQLLLALPVLLVALVLALVGGGYGLLAASLPKLDGQLQPQHSGLSGPVHISRDRLGVVSIEADTRADLAYATGFAHAQDRFFEMDLSRRLAAGELSELVGNAALSQDTLARRFRFRALAQTIMTQLPEDQRRVADAYTRGVNAGLASLATRPWEYWLLGSPPAAWRPEDSLLVAYAMWWDLQASSFRREILRHELNARLGGAACEGGWKCAMTFLYPSQTAWDAAVDQAPDSAALPASQAGTQPGAALGAAPGGPPAGSQASGQPPATPAPNAVPTRVGAPAQIPGPDVVDVRGKTVSWAAPAGGEAPLPYVPPVGSNSWAVGGAHTASGAALIANDMHLPQRVPAIWYRMRLTVSGKGADPAVDLNGVTLPGAPVQVAGSNGHIAWGFTNSYGSWLDVSAVPCTAISDTELTTAHGPVRLSVAHEEIRVHGDKPVQLAVLTGPDGLLISAQPQRGVCWFGRWIAQVPQAVNLGLLEMEHVDTAAAALALAPQLGIPHQNFVVGDRAGHIGWSIAGRIPAGSGADRYTAGAGWVAPEDAPRIYDPAAGRIWTANAQVVADPRQARLLGGDSAAYGSEYDLPARARQIRDDLLALNQPATPADMLHIQLDDRALFLARWQQMLLKLLDADALSGSPQRAQLRSLVERWDGHASPDSVSYRIVRAFREHVQTTVWEMLLNGLDIPVDENALVPTRFEQPLWQLVNEQPLHLLAPNHPSWRELLLQQVDVTATQLTHECGELSRCSWGHGRPVRIRHPLSRALPSWLSGLFDMPSVELPGDHFMPRVQDGAFGASERFAVSPGHEAEGYLHLPGGQSGNPLSPFYRAGFEAWARGEPQPFLPGPAEHQLTLRP